MRPGGTVTRAAALAAPVLATCLLSVALRLPFLAVPLTDDEAGYAYVSSWLGRGLTLYRDLWFDRPQGIFLLYGGILWLFGDEPEAIRFAAAAYNAGTTFALWLLGRRLIGPRGALAAALLYAIASASPAIEGFTANGELFMNLPSVLALLAAVCRRPFAAGALLAAATLIKPTALPGVALALGAAWLAGVGDEPRSRRTAARLGAGLLLAAAPFAAHGVLTGLDEFWYAVVGFRVEAHSAFSAGARFFDELRQTGPHVTWALLPVWALVALWLRRGHWRSASGAVLLAFLGGTLVGAALGGYWYWHYFVGVVPAAALIAGDAAARDVLPLAARALDRLRWWRRAAGLAPVAASRTGTASPRPAPRGAARPALVSLLGFAAVAVSLVSNVSLVGATPDETSWRLYRREGYLASREVGRYLRERTAPDDTIYAAFAGADVYFMSRRRSAGRHLYWTEINRVPGALDAVLRTLDDPRRCPKYVVRLQRELEQPGRADPFWERIERRFFPEAVIRGVILYRRLDD